MLLDIAMHDTELEMLEHMTSILHLVEEKQRNLELIVIEESLQGMLFLATPLALPRAQGIEGS